MPIALRLTTIVLASGFVAGMTTLALHLVDPFGGAWRSVASVTSVLAALTVAAKTRPAQRRMEV
jgi:hypothetical protein